MTPSIYGSEILISFSLVVSAVIALGYLKPFYIFPLIFVHGHALGEAMVGAEPTPLLAYLLGLLFSQSLVVSLGIIVFKNYLNKKRLFSIGFAGIGLTLACSAMLNSW